MTSFLLLAGIGICLLGLCLLFWPRNCKRCGHERYRHADPDGSCWARIPDGESYKNPSGVWKQDRKTCGCPVFTKVKEPVS